MRPFRPLAVLALAAAAVFACGKPSPAVPQQDGLVVAPPPAILLRYRGTNLSGGEFGSKLPGTAGVDYKWPSASDADYFLDRGMNFFRIPFLHERMQPVKQAALDEAYWDGLFALVQHISARGGLVVLEAHNGFRHNGVILTEFEIGDLWGRIAGRLLTTPNVAINPTNEPHDMSTDNVVALDTAAVREVRRVGFKGYVFAPGNGFTGVMSWPATWYGESNASKMAGVVDTGNMLAIEAHLYLDSDGSGSGKDCVSASIGEERLAPFIAWLRSSARVGVIGEIGAPNTPTCKAAVTRSLAMLEANYDVILGWSVWSAGVWSYGATGSYPLTIGPTAAGQPERAQLAWYRAFLPAAPVTCTSADAGR